MAESEALALDAVWWTTIPEGVRGRPVTFLLGASETGTGCKGTPGRDFGPYGAYQSCHSIQARAPHDKGLSDCMTFASLGIVNVL